MAQGKGCSPPTLFAGVYAHVHHEHATTPTTTSISSSRPKGHTLSAAETPPLPALLRNQAPGIPDRRKTFRNRSNRTVSRGKRAYPWPPVRNTMADVVAAEMKGKDMDDSDETEEKEDAFKDAEETESLPLSELNPSNAKDEALSEGLGINMIDGTTDAAPMSETTIERNAVPESTTTTANDAELKDPSPPSASHSRQSTLGQTSTPVPGVPNAAEASTLSHSRQPTLELAPTPIPESRDRSVSPSKRAHAPSGDLPTLGSLPPPPSSLEEQESAGPRITSPPLPGAGLARKASSGFGALLGRMGTMRNSARSPPAPRTGSGFAERRNTSISMTSMDGASTTGLGPIAAGLEDGARGRPSLQDQFSSLRRQEEYSNGLDGPGGDGRRSRSNTQGEMEPPRPLSPMKSPPLNASLPPGTALGMSAGPSVEDQEVNWDLWQQVVYEGPAAVARTSGDDLNRAIASGIPPAIRGVVWQVLAESKNEELENIYRTLKARGTDSEQRPAASRAMSNISLSSANPEKEGTDSDGSSIHSDNSTLASPPTSVDSTGAEIHAKVAAEKQKREAVALQKLEKAIKRDLGARTSYSKYTQSAGLQDGLFGVCKAYALFDEGVGYAQGINFIAMPLLFNLSEEESFTLLVRLMSKYDLRNMFTADMVGLHLHLYQFERLLEDFEPAVYCHLKRRNVGPQLYATQWFLTLFAYRFPLQLVLRIYDLIFSEGLTAILKFGIVLMQRNRAALLAMKDMSALTTFLKEKIFDVYIDKSPTPSSLLDSGFFGSVTGGADKELYRAEEMVRDACGVDISEATLARYTVEWEESRRVERERETELETLRVSNATMTTKVKGLEERVQQHDAEHVQMAQDVVRLKVENDELQDVNEGLKLQVMELQKLLDAQPAEVEDRLKQEMDRIMHRNIEVQNENRSLKEEMGEMEHELVNAKMKHAEAQSDHDQLKQKWSSVQALLNGQ